MSRKSRQIELLEQKVASLKRQRDALMEVKGLPWLRRFCLTVADLQKAGEPIRGKSYDGAGGPSSVPTPDLERDQKGWMRAELHKAMKHLDPANTKVYRRKLESVRKRTEGMTHEMGKLFVDPSHRPPPRPRCGGCGKFGRIGAKGCDTCLTPYRRHQEQEEGAA